MTAPADWQRLDPRMLLVQPVREVVRFLPALVAVVVAGSATGGLGAWWQLALVVLPVGLGVLRYLTTAFRITPARVELRRGLLNRHVLSTPRDRVRTVDVTAPPIHRLLGLTSVRIGTGTASTHDEDRLDLDGLPAPRARELRVLLLHDEPAGPRGGAAGPEGVGAERTVLELDPAWVRFAPLTSAGLVITAGVLGVTSQVLNTVGGLGRLHPERIADGATSWSAWVAVPLALVGLAGVVSALSVGGYLVTHWGFRLTHSPGAWHLRRGLVTTRETTLDEDRVRGVWIGEPLGLRLAGGARATAIATGLDSGQSALLVPPAPRGVVDGAAAAVLGTGDPLTAALVGHGPRARSRRFSRALAPAGALLLLAAVSVPVAGVPVWVPALAALGVPLALALGADRARALGHALVADHLVVRSGSLDRRREALETDAVIGWNLRATWFQRRAGLTTLVATTAGGRQSVTAPDVPEDLACGLALRAHPEVVAQFLVSPETEPTADPPRAS